MKKSKTLKIVAIFLCGLLFLQQTGFAQLAPSTAEGVASIELNIASRFTTLANTFSPDKFRPLHLRSLSYDGLNNNFKLLLDKGDIKDPKTQDIESTAKDLLNYFFVGIALPNDAFWVNLRPDSPNDIIDPLLAQTEVGKILLEADLQLKKDTANATNPSTPEGREYWNKLYQKAGELYGTQNVTIPTLTRPWIVPDEIIIRESTDSAYVYKATLKVMLEQDYLKGNATYAFKDDREKQLNEYSSQIIREEIIPKLTKEINNAKRYAPLRQVYYSLILAQWFKARNQDKNTRYSRLINRKDLTNLQAKIPYSVNAYFNAYKENFAKGEYNIKEPISTPYGQVIRSYFSGGIAGIAPLIPGLGQSISVNPKGASITLVPGKGQGTADSGMLSVEAPGGGEGVRVIAQPGGLGDLGQGSSGSDAFIKSQFKFTQGALGFAQAKQGNSKVLDALKAARQKLLAEFDLGLERRAQKVLERNVSMTELEGIKKAHAIGEGHFLGKQNEDGSYENNKDPELVFTPEEIARKARILKDAGFTLEERAKLIKFGVAGSAAISSLPSKIKRTIFIWLAITALLFPSLACNDTVPTPVSAVIPTTIVSDSYIATQTAFSPVLGQVGEQIPAVMNFAANVVPSQYQGYVQAFKDVVMTKGVLTGGESVVMDGITVNQGLGYSFLVHPGENNTTEKVEINMQFLQPLMDAAFTIENGQVTIKNATLAYVLFSQFIHEGHHIQNIGTPGGAYNYLKDNELAIWQAVNIYDTNDSAMNNYVRRSAAEALETIIVGEVEGSAGFLSMQYLRDMGITAVNLQENINGSLPPSVEFVLSTAVQQIQVVDPLEYRARLLTSWGYGSRVSWYLPHPDGWSPYILDALANQLLKGDPNRNYGWLADPRLLNIHLDPLSDNIELQVDQYTQLIVDVLASYGIIIPDPTSSSMLAPSKSTTSVSPAHVIFSQSKVVGPLARKGFQRGPGPSISFTGVGDEQQANRNILVGILSILLQQGKITEAELQERLAFDANPKSEPAEDLDLSVDNQNVFMVNGQKVVVIDAPYLSATEEGEQYASAGLRRGVVYITRQKFEELKNNGALEEIIKHEQIESSYLRQKAMEMFPGLDEATAYELFSNFLKNPNNQDQARDLIDEAHQYAESQRHSADTGVSITGQVKTGAAVVQAASSAVNARENIITMRLDKFWNISPWRAKINASNYYNSFENELKEKLESIVVAYKIDYEKFMGILIACDEVALNIMLHGGGGTIQVFLTRADDGTSWIEIIGENNNNKGIKDPRIELENSKVARVNDKANSGGGFLNIVFYPDKVTIETDRKRWEKSGTDKSNVSLVNTATSDVQGTKMTLAWQVGQAVAGSLAEARAVRVEEPVSDTKFPVQTQRQQLQSDPTRKSIRYFPKIFQDDLMRVVKDLDSNQSLLGYTVYFRNIPDLEGVPHKNSWGIQFTGSNRQVTVWINGEPILPKTQVHVFHHFDIVDTPNGTYQVQLNEFFNLRLNPVLAPNGSYRNMTANEYAARFIKTLQKTITIQAKQAIDIIHQLASFYQGTYSLQFEGDKPYLKVYEKKFLAMLGVSRRQVYDIKDGTVIKIDSGNQIPRELYIWKFDAEAQKNLARVYGWGLIQDSKGTKYYIREENLLPLIIYESDAKLERLKARLAIIHQQNAPDMNQQVNKKLQEYGIRREADIHRIDELFNYMEKFHMGDIRVNQLGYRENGEIVIIDWGDAEETLLENKFGTYKLFKTLLSVDYQQYKNNLLQSGEGVLSIEEYLNMFQLQPTIITEIHPFPASPVLESQVVSEAAVASGAMKPLGLRDPLDEDRSDNSLRSKFAGIDFRFLPIVIQSIDSLKASIRSMSVSSLQRINLTQEWSDIERLVNSGITPSAERLKEYLAASCFKGSLDSDMERIVSCISDILRMQEETCCATDPALKDILVVLGSGRSGQELKLAFAN